MNFTDQQFTEVRISAEETFKSIGEVFCPVLGHRVSFNSLGLNHLKMKRWNHARDRADQYTRLKLLRLAPGVLKMSHTIQGKLESKRFERIKVNSRWEQKMVHVSYYEFIAITHGCRLRVVVKQIDSGPIYFWSLVPYWKQGKQGKRMFEGNPEED